MAAILEIAALQVAAHAEGGDARLIVHGVDLSLGQGEVVGLIGESGAGKSTIGLAALGYTRPGCTIVGGRIRFRNADVLSLPSAQRRGLRGRHIAYVSQSAAASFNPAKSILAQVCEGPVRHGLMGEEEARDRAIGLFELLDLPKPRMFGSRYPHQVSGGQLQRAMAAMAMSCGPEILVLDEPTTALDVTTQIEVLAALRNLIRDHQTAALYITHDLAVVAQLAHRIVVLRGGRVIETGEAGQILRAPRHDYTQRLVATRVGVTRPPLGPAAKPLLTIEGVSAHYRTGQRVLENVNLAVRHGETVAVVGESGSGKTSLARAICGILPCDTGHIRLRDECLAPTFVQRSREQLRRIQMVYQMPDVALNPRQTVLEIVGRPVAFYFARSRDEVRARVEELLSLIDLPPSVLSRRPDELSGGQQQRVAIARALAAQPEVVVCDEVTSGLDPIVEEEILRLLARLQRQMSVAYVFISHDLGTVRRVADRVVVMQNGVVVEEGPVETVFEVPSHPYTQQLLASVPQMRVDWLEEVLRGRSEGALTE